MLFKKLVIVGGGFGGWYTAAAFRHNFPNMQIVVIDSDEHPRLGVGETLGWSAPYDLKRHLGLNDDRLFMFRTGAIYKYGVTLTDFFEDNSVYSYGKFFNLKISSLAKFYNAFDYPDFLEPWSKQPGDQGIQQAWMSLNQNNNKNFRDYINELNEAEHFVKGPYAPYNANNSCVMRSNDGYSYHVDAEQTVSLLKELSLTSELCQHITSPVVNVALDAQGNISKIYLKNETEVSGDLYIDASGFARALMKFSVNNTWKHAGSEYCNSAWVCPSRHVNIETTLTGGTEIHGEDHGWRFKVNLYHRAGNGYVFNTNQTDPDIPLMKLIGLTQGTRFVEPRQLKWEPGHYAVGWQGNVIPLGVSGHFIDPYDAPTFDVHSRALEDLVAALQLTDVDAARKQYNRARDLVIEERELRLVFNFGLTARSGAWWDSRRDMLTKNNYNEKFVDIINESRSDIDSRLQHFWLQMYYRMLMSGNLDRKKFKFPRIDSHDAEMANSFFNYNRARNRYISQSEWPNYYQWLKENRFNNLTSQEVLANLHPQWKDHV